jgi:site-specific DNA recombinase
LNDEGVPVGPFVVRDKWTGKLVEELLRDTMLSGQRRLGLGTYKPVYRTGKSRKVANPKPPELKTFPELAHFTPEEHDELLRVMDARKAEARAGHPSGRASPLFNVPRTRTYWPGQSISCGVCGGLFYRFGAVMKCQNARGQGPKDCWNRVQVRIDQVHEKVLPLVLQYLDRHPRAREVVTQAAWQECQRLRGRQNRSAAGLDQAITGLDRQAKQLAKAIAQGGPLDSLVAELSSIEAQLAKARAERSRLADSGDTAGAFRSIAELKEGLDRALQWLAAASRDFAEILRRLFTTFVVVPVQGLDHGQVRPRARVVLSAAAWETEGQTAPELAATIDLFDSPDYIQSLAKCVAARERAPTASLTTLAGELRMNHMQVKRALDYHAVMLAKGVSDPYQEVAVLPSNAARWGKRGDPTPGHEE